jgi:hypothetical protein
MELYCAECGCLVEDGVRVVPCGTASCCSLSLPVQHRTVEQRGVRLQAAGGDQVTNVGVPVDGWRVRGSYFEACNCEAICPCRSVGGQPGGPSSYGECFGTLSWQVHDGHWGDVDLSELMVVMSLRYFDRVKPSTKWEVVLYVDERSDGAQRAALAQIFLGRAGGTVAELYGPAIGEVHAVRPARITVEHVAPRKRIDVVGYVMVEAEGQAMCSAASLASTIPAPNWRVVAWYPTIPCCGGRSGASATPRSAATSTTDPRYIPTPNGTRSLLVKRLTPLVDRPAIRRPHLRGVRAVPSEPVAHNAESVNTHNCRSALA